MVSRADYPFAGINDPLDFQFKADKYGPFSDRLRHLLNALDGTYLHCDKRLSDAGPSDTIWFDEGRRQRLDLYLQQETSEPLRNVLELTARRIDGFESPLGMELLATVDWLIEKEHCEATVAGIREGLRQWSAGQVAVERKLRCLMTDLSDWQSTNLRCLLPIPDPA